MSDEAAFDALLAHLRRTRGFDFSAYKRSSLKRRIEKRMGTVGLADYESYLDHLEVHPDEFGALFTTILINVTSFFRDAAVWEYVAAEALPALIRAKDGASPIRIWSAACASGEEAYTLAMVLVEALGEQAFRDRVKIYATDADESAQAAARQAVYTPRQVEGVPPRHLAKYFTALNGNYMFSFVVDASGTFVLANDQARRLFGIPASDIGRPLKDLDLSYRPADLRSAIKRAAADRRPIAIKNVEWSVGPGDGREFDVEVTPPFDQAGATLGYEVSFADITRIRGLQAELQHSRHELETAYEELRSTNEALETTNEELQSTVEELETTNEERQSTNEELETINEELQTMNEELRTRSGDLNELNAFLKSILTSLRAGIVVVDRSLAVQVWNERAEDLWGLRSEEVRGAHLLNLDIGLPVAELKSAIKDILAEADGSRVTVVQATNRRGRGFACRVTASPLRGGDHSVTGAILIMEDQQDVEGASR